MPRKTHDAVKLGLMLLAGGMLAGCVVEQPRPAPRPAVAAGIYYVPAPPPAPIYEVQTAPPGPLELFFWQPGHWRWEGGRYIWHRGIWARRPHPAAVWMAPHWEQRPQGYVFIEGRWN
jgi:hypothetical protein